MAFHRGEHPHQSLANSEMSGSVTRRPDVTLGKGCRKGAFGTPYSSQEKQIFKCKGVVSGFGPPSPAVSANSTPAAQPGG